jgi:hypothetical protein
MALRNIVRSRFIYPVATLLGIVLAFSGCAAVQSSSSSRTTPETVSVTVTPPTASVQVSKTQQFAAAVTNTTNTAVTWQVNGTAGGDSTHGTINTSGMYTAPAAVPSPAAVTITAISQAQSTQSASAQATVTAGATPPIVVTTSVPTASVQAGHTQMFSATVQNDSQNEGVTWTLAGAGCTGAACGTLSSASSASGAAITYTAPAAVPTPATVTLTATSVADATKSAVTTLTVISATTPVIIVTVNPTSVSVQAGQTHAVTATVQNDSQNKGVSWKLTGTGCTGATCGTISAASSASGTAITYTAPATVPAPATVTLTATSIADATKSAVTTLTLTSAAPAAIVVTVNPTAVSVQTGQAHSLVATVQNDTKNQGVTWTLSGAGCTGAACGTLSAASSASGVAITYTAPASVPTPASVTATAKSVTDTTKTASATITVTTAVTGGISVTISPVRVGLTTGEAQTFTASVTGTTTTTVTWAVDTIPGGSASVGTISASGVYTPPSGAGTHTVSAISVADTTVSASASVAITNLAGVYTYHNDLSRDGVNSQEYALNTTSVKAATFGKRFACTIDASAYAQPLWVANVAIGGGTHNIVIAATEHDTVYAFDADASPCQTYWSKSLLASGETWVSSNDVNTTDLTPDIGIVGTPVIDPSTNTLYLVSKSKTTSGTTTFHQRLHAMSLTDGSEKANSPAAIAFTSGGITFDALRQNQRAGLALVNGVLYIAYASHGDNPVYYGWVLAYNPSTLAQTAAFNDDPSAGYGGIWMAGGAPAADSSGNLYVITGNGNFDGSTQFGDSFLKLSAGTMSVLSYFAPSNQASLSSGDLDVGSGGTAVLVDATSGPNPHLLIGGGKVGQLFVLNRDNLGGNTSNDSGVVQSFTLSNGIFATPAFWQNTMYIGLVNDHVKAYSFNATSRNFTTSPASQSPGSFGFPGSTPSVSALGTTNGIVWAIEYASPAVLHAYDATNLGTELWNSSTKSADQAGAGIKFSVPTVANGKVYVGTASEVSVYGLSPN